MATEPAETRELEVIEPPYQPQSALSPMEAMTHQLSQCWASVKDDAPEWLTLQMATVGKSTIEANDAIGKELSIVAALVKPVALADKETGEVVERPCTVLLTSDGDTVVVFSTGILQSLAILASKRPKGRYNPPLLVTFRQMALKSGHRKFYLEPVAPAIPANKPKGGNGGK